jgi:hypothetical protein
MGIKRDGLRGWLRETLIGPVLAGICLATLVELLVNFVSPRFGDVLLRAVNALILQARWQIILTVPPPFYFSPYELIPLGITLFLGALTCWALLWLYQDQGTK